MQWKITPYEGKEPYIFISYCHNDQSVVFPLLEMMDRAGFRVWYDGGIQWGENGRILLKNICLAVKCVWLFAQKILQSQKNVI